MHPGLSLFKQRFSPRLVRDVIDLQVRRKIRRLSTIYIVGLPDSRQVGLAVRQSWQGCRKVRLAFRCLRDADRRYFRPLCLKRCRHQDEDRNRTDDYCFQSSLPKLRTGTNYISSTEGYFVFPSTTDREVNQSKAVIDDARFSKKMKY